MRHAELPSWYTKLSFLLKTLLGAILSLSGAHIASGQTPYDPSNCYSWAEYRVGELPPMWDMMNAAKKITPKKGDLAMFYYEKAGLPHIAVVEYVFHSGSFYVSEANMYHLYKGGVGTRIIQPDYKNFVGIYEQGQVENRERPVYTGDNPSPAEGVFLEGLGQVFQKRPYHYHLSLETLQKGISQDQNT